MTMDHEQEIAALKEAVGQMRARLEGQAATNQDFLQFIAKLEGQVLCLNQLVGMLIAEHSREAADPELRVEQIIAEHEARLFDEIAATPPGHPLKDQLHRQREEQLAIAFNFARSLAKQIALER
jgi:hypothetical protein